MAVVTLSYAHVCDLVTYIETYEYKIDITLLWKEGIGYQWIYWNADVVNFSYFCKGEEVNKPPYWSTNLMYIRNSHSWEIWEAAVNITEKKIVNNCGPQLPSWHRQDLDLDLPVELSKISISNLVFYSTADLGSSTTKQPQL